MLLVLAPKLRRKNSILIHTKEQSMVSLFI